MLKDYYKILGITEFDKADKIKNAYRVLARRWHPDVAGNTQDVLDKFKEINEAYEILSNKIKKDEYDRARQFYNYAKNGSSGSSQPSEETKQQKNTNEKTASNFKNSSFNFNWEEILCGKRRKEAFKREEANMPQKGRDLYTDIEVSCIEALEGTLKTVNMLQTHVCPKCKGKKFANGTVCNHCHGKGKVSEYKKFNVKIPSGIKNNSKIRLSAEGLCGENGGKNGDLYITIHILEDSNFEMQGVDVFKKISITPYEAVLGCSIKVDTPNGKVDFRLAAGTQTGQKIRLSGCGIVQNNKVGDMIITVEIRIPKKLSDTEFELYKKLEEISSLKDRKELYD